MVKNVLITAAGFACMEGASWIIHRYLMHGPLWFIHRTHHTPQEGYFEFNDVFTLFFGSVATILILLGVGTFDYRFWIGLGITLYGVVYFFVHDVLIHRRVRWFKRPRVPYLQRITKAHQIHHQSREKHPSRSFGLLWTNNSVFKQSN